MKKTTIANSELIAKASEELEEKIKEEKEVQDPAKASEILEENERSGKNN